MPLVRQLDAAHCEIEGSPRLFIMLALGDTGSANSCIDCRPYKEPLNLDLLEEACRPSLLGLGKTGSVPKLLISYS